MADGSPSELGTQHAALIPSWCEWRSGRGCVLLVAPHGGRRPPVDPLAPPSRLRVNDVYTPEVTRILADGLDAGFIVNTTQDRNRLDLNRLSQVRRQAPWFLDLLVREIAKILERHAHAEVIFIHGWNTGQVKCDIGIGAIETGNGLQVPDGAECTVSESYLRARIDALRRSCAERAIQTAIGERYPASHPNNLLQIFRAQALAPGDWRAEQISAWVAAGRVNAVQVELSIPLRWPGMWRDRFVEAVVQANESVPTSPQRRATSTPSTSTQDSALSTPPQALQFYDPAADIGMFAGLGRTGPHSIGGRLLLFLGGQCIALFTGEEAAARGDLVPPLRIATVRDTVHLTFDGPMLRLRDAAVYLDLEAALAESDLVQTRVDLCFEPARQPAANSAPTFGRIGGSVVVDGRRADITTSGFANAGALRASGARQQTMLAADFGAGRALVARAVDGEPASPALRFTPGTLNHLDGARIAISTDGDVYTPAVLELQCDDHPPLTAHPLSRMAILRPSGHGSYLRVTFGVARFTWGGEVGHGLYEHARPVTPPTMRQCTG